MGKQFETIPTELIDWIREQPVFFVASAPLSGDGSVNVSPKGGPNTLHIVDERSCFYIDLTGSGSETSAHMMERGNARLTIMLCQLTEGPPNIVRLFGTGKIHERGTVEFEKRTEGLDLLPGARAIVWLDITAVTTACGYSVPIYEHVRHRPTLDQFFEKKEAQVGADGVESYWAQKNSVSIDGLPAIGSRIGVSYPGVVKVDKVLYRHQKRGVVAQPRRLSSRWLDMAIGAVLALLSLRIVTLMQSVQ